jgi:omega-6 fatty acid desaturase (delta-12 desaturase)
MTPASLAPFVTPDPRRSVGQLAATAIPYALLWGAMAFFVSRSYAVALLLAFPAAAFLVRLFMLLHDCAHGSFFRSRAANDAVGSAIGLLTLTPYAWWQRTHAIHHATAGNLDRRGIGDIATLTVGEYLRLSRARRLAYRLYRNPLVLFGIGPAWHFAVWQRLPSIAPRSWRRERTSVHATNLALFALLALAALTGGLKALVLVQLPITILACSGGVWLFYVQHQFDGTYWERDGGWDPLLASLHGSSYYKLPGPLKWLTCNIGIHHLHHLAPKIPNYRLEECLRDNPALNAVPKVTLWQSMKCLSLKLWDEECGRLVRYRDLRALHRLS